MKISLYSETFGKRVTRWYDVSVVDGVLNTSNDDVLFNNVIAFLLSISGYKNNYKENLTYIFK